LASFFPQKSRFFLSYEIRSLACALDGTDTEKWSEEEHAFLLKAAGYLMIDKEAMRSSSKIGGLSL
jgi:hypothetical protein